MLTPYNQSKFVYKTLTAATGEQFRVVFLLTMINGEVRVRVISANPISKPNIIFLPKFNKKQSTISTVAKTPTKKAESPFNTLFFFNSQPTRAPSL
ncbi:MAG: hypothetical protein A3B11_01815 [Candidatus Taylorbacteria bacterium RIFCSPLOWO2_01_FULL_44_26]|uniref:Uncharacterized protein n=2 Tax=Candidatus Tayloriibacteriota TaxID=1817919 RepID=A0A1G2MJ72_9BACT|nr:MAG: hypothetical protein A3D50_02080 [Candidatus Taylorbacteria bacterium RIFCSPHIGHO2_02_FULL_44_12]OHA31410.1 MAG: hypothetical protein A3B11_01815 [Candidatus Taylorbacteria bacterium RIFCSPLOWO2_01_FULL_44_26]